MKLKIVTTNWPSTCSEQLSRMSTPQLSQRCGRQTVVSKLTRKTTSKVQVLMYQWSTNRYYAGYDGQVIGKKDSVHTQQYHAIHLYVAYSNLLQLCTYHTYLGPFLVPIVYFLLYTKKVKSMGTTLFPSMVRLARNVFKTSPFFPQNEDVEKVDMR